MNKVWRVDSQSTSYNSWLREEAVKQNSMLLKSMAKLQAQLQVLPSVISLEEITSERSARVLLAVNHLMTELRLLVTLQERI